MSHQVGKVHHKDMKGGLAEGGGAALTAFVLSALLDAGVSKQDQMVQDALLCLSAQVRETHIYRL